MTNLAREQIFDADDLPMRLTALTPCFRSEAGSYGQDTRGMIRQHQFEKVELVHLVHPDQSVAALGGAHRACRGCPAKTRAAIPRRVTVCTGDIGFAATKTYDIEVWLPGQEEVSRDLVVQ